MEETRLPLSILYVKQGIYYFSSTNLQSISRLQHSSSSYANCIS